MEKIQRLLLIDDNDTTNFYNEDLLGDMGLFEEIVVLTNGTDAIEYFRKCSEGEEKLPNLVFLDIKMPDFDGFEVLDEIEDMEIEGIESSKICILTTSKHKRDTELFEHFSLAVEFLEKPLRVEKVEQIVKKHLRSLISNE